MTQTIQSIYDQSKQKIEQFCLRGAIGVEFNVLAHMYVQGTFLPTCYMFRAIADVAGMDLLKKVVQEISPDVLKFRLMYHLLNTSVAVMIIAGWRFSTDPTYAMADVASLALLGIFSDFIYYPNAFSQNIHRIDKVQITRSR